MLAVSGEQGDTDAKKKKPAVGAWRFHQVRVPRQLEPKKSYPTGPGKLLMGWCPRIWVFENNFGIKKTSGSLFIMISMLHDAIKVATVTACFPSTLSSNEKMNILRNQSR